MSQPASALIVAAGSGERLGADLPKALVEVGGLPMFEWSLRALAAAPAVGELVLAAPVGYERQFAAVADSYGATVVTGGEVRSASVLAALDASPGAATVLVHDAARPLLTPALAEAVLTALWRDPELGGMVAAAPVADTLKRAEGSAEDGWRVLETVPRADLWAIQTPQAFPAAVLRRALAQPEALAGATDDAMLVEGLGRRVGICAGPEPNFKVTTPADLRLAEAVLGLT